jgi:tyrosyl-tRNA synthetase
VEKMSKSLDNYVGITESPGEIYGKIMSISDPLMFRYYELLTDVPLSQIDKWKKDIKAEKAHPKDLKCQLAESIVTDFWGKKEAERAAEEFERVFKHKEIPLEVEDIEIHVKDKAKVTDYPLIDLLVEQNIFPSRGEAKRMIRQGGIYLDGQRIADLDLKVKLPKEQELILKIGKRKFYRLKAKN